MVVMSEPRSKVQRVLAAVLHEMPRSTVTESSTMEVIDSWTESDDTLCVLYRWPGAPCVVGLRRQIESDVTVGDLVDEIVNFEIGEPLGSVFDPKRIDAEGVFWWDGGPADSHSYSWGKPRRSRLRVWLTKFGPDPT